MCESALDPRLTPNARTLKSPANAGLPCPTCPNPPASSIGTIHPGLVVSPYASPRLTTPRVARPTAAPQTRKSASFPLVRGF